MSKKNNELNRDDDEILDQNSEIIEENNEVNNSDIDNQIVILTQQNTQLNEQLLRTMAEFDNYKKRTLKEKQEMTVFTKAMCVKDILSVIDNFERALLAETSDNEFKKGIEMIFNQLSDSLKKLGVEEIEALNKPFDPEFHNAINQVEDDNFGENTICQVFQKGYKIEDKVIRHSMVVVANP